MVPYHHKCHIWMSKEVEKTCFKLIIWGDKASQKGQDQFLWKEGFSLCNTAI